MTDHQRHLDDLAAANAPIPTWKVLVPLVIPAVLLWATVLTTPGRHIDTPLGRALFGASFMGVGIWCGYCGVVWHRLSDAFKVWWRPNAVITPWLLAVVFVCVGGWQLVDGLTQLAE